eukprot:935515-Amphidinium_carterae.2
MARGVQTLQKLCTRSEAGQGDTTPSLPQVWTKCTDAYDVLAHEQNMKQKVDVFFVDAFTFPRFGLVFVHLESKKTRKKLSLSCRTHCMPKSKRSA